MALSSSALSTDPRIQIAYTDKARPLAVGEPQGIATARIQAALVRLGYKLPISTRGGGADGKFGDETRKAVISFQNANGLKPDGLVGHNTLDKLDAQLNAAPPSPPNPPNPPAPVNADLQIIAVADARRKDALTKAEAAILEIKAAFEPNPPDLSNPTVQAIQRQMFFPPDSNFWPRVNKALNFIQNNLHSKTKYQVDRADTSCFAHVDPTNEKSKGIWFCAGFFADGTTDNCRQEVITHEYFHFFVGLGHFYGSRDPEEALKCPHHMARLVFDLAVHQRFAPCDPKANLCG